jgi:hypothetical protein
MISQHDKRFLLPGDTGWPRRSPTTKCPNPACGVDLIVTAESVGKKRACPSCGANLVCSKGNGVHAAKSAPAAVQPYDLGAAASATKHVRHEAPSERANTLPIVRTGCIGRGNAGKTALIRALSDGPIGDFLPSGLHVDAGDPREVAQMIRESEQTQRLLHLAGLPPTLVASRIRYCVYEGAEQRAICELDEVIGQVLTHTLPNSAAELQARYDDYLANLVNTHVLWTVVPCPPSNPGPRERRRYANDLRISLAFLREAIRLRSLEQPVAVAVVLSKIDTLFASAREAQSVLTDQMLSRAFGPLVDLIHTSERVSEAAIIPVTAFGFGNAMVKELSGPRAESSPDAVDEPFGTEPVWILREGVDPVPFNLDALFLWTLLFGLRGQEATRAIDLGRQSWRISDKVQDDLESANPWIHPLK